jgi:hypothetical protein
MKATSAFRSLIITALICMGTKLSAQKGHHPHNHHPHAKKAVVVKRSAYRPAKVVVFHPAWRPKYAYYRRWVFFPKYNLYWDNWRNHYVFWNGTMWLSQPTSPPVIVNVNLENEKSRELKEEEDDVDDIYKDNEAHKKE